MISKYKYIFATIVLISSSSCSLYGGCIWSKQSRANSLDQVLQEFNSFLQTIDVESISTRSYLEKYIETKVNQNIRDAKKFPLFNAYIYQDEFMKNEALQEQLGNAIEKTAKDFIEKRIAQLFKE